LVNAKHPLSTPEGHFVLYVGHSNNMESLVTDTVTDILIRFPAIAQNSRTTFIELLVGLVV